MAIYDGVVTVADEDIPVIVELDDSHVRLSASGTEIGLWAIDECYISHLGDTTYTITAEDETIEFVPNEPSLFAAAVNGGLGDGVVAAPTPEAESDPVTSDGILEAPPARSLTMGLFYALCVATAALAVWSLISMVL